MDDLQEPCLCCGADEASEWDSHCGEVCEECAEDMYEIGEFLAGHPALDLRHPPKIGSHEAALWMKNNH